MKVLRENSLFFSFVLLSQPPYQGCSMLIFSLKVLVLLVASHSSVDLIKFVIRIQTPIGTIEVDVKYTFYSTFYIDASHKLLESKVIATMLLW